VSPVTEGAVSVTKSPEQNVKGPEAVIVAVGRGFTVTEAVAELLHPTVGVPVTVYIVVTAGVAVTVAPVDGVRPIAGNHV
jgi:hypothetical protein